MMSTVAVPFAEQLEDSLSDEVHERQVDPRDHSTVIRRTHLEHPPVTSDLSRHVGHDPSRLYGNGAYCAFLAHTVCPYFATVNPPTRGRRPGGLTLVARVP